MVALEAGEVHALSKRHHLGLVDEEAQRLDGQLVFQLELLAVEGLEAVLGLDESHLQVLDGVLDVRVCLDETGLRLVTAQLDARSARAVDEPRLDQLQSRHLVLDSLAKVLDVVLHLRYQFLQLHIAVNSGLAARASHSWGGAGVPNHL